MFFPVKEMKHCNTVESRKYSLNSSSDFMNQTRKVREFRLPMICRTDVILNNKDNRIKYIKNGKENDKKYCYNFKQKRVKKDAILQTKILNNIMKNQIDRWEYTQSPVYRA